MTKTVAPPHNLWKVARVDVDRLATELRDEVLAWIGRVTWLPDDEIRGWVRPTLVVSQCSDDLSYRLHLTRMSRDGQGRIVVDHAAGRVQTEPLVFDITDFPAWLPAVSHQQGDS